MTKNESLTNLTLNLFDKFSHIRADVDCLSFYEGSMYGLKQNFEYTALVYTYYNSSI